MAAYEVLLLNTAIPQIQAAQSGDTYVVPRDIAFSAALTLSAGTANGVPYLNGSKVVTTSSALQFDGANLGLGVTPSTWASNFVAMQIGPGATVNSASDGRAAITSNIFIAPGPTAKYISNGFGAAYTQLNGAHLWFTAPNNTSGPNIDASGGSTTMTLDASGNLTVGTTTNSGRLTVADSTAAGTATNTFVSMQTLEDSSTKAALTLRSLFTNSQQTNTLVASINLGVITNGTASPSAEIRFNTIDSGTFTERARITSGGYFKASNDGTYQGITGTFHEVRQSASDIALHIGNTAASAPEGILVRYNAASPNNTSSAFLFCVDSTATRATIRSNGGLANYQANNVDLSDIRTKKEIASAASMWDKVAALEIVEYKYIDQTHDDVNLGVIAQQVETVEPVWVDTDGFGETPEGEEPLKTVYNKDIYFAAIKALQEAMTRIEQLEAKVAALQGA